MSIFRKSIPAALIIASVSIFIPTTAQSTEIPTRGPIPFTAYDKDSNNFISEDEFNQARSARMTAKAAEGKGMRGMANAPSFSSFDTNNDGQLTQDELAAGQKYQMQQRNKMGRGMGQGGRMGQGMNKGRNMPSFSEFDLNGDGFIPEDEFDQARSNRISTRAQQGYQMKNIGNAPSFASIDTNDDGKISASEFTAHQATHRQQRN